MVVIELTRKNSPSVSYGHRNINVWRDIETSYHGLKTWSGTFESSVQYSEYYYTVLINLGTTKYIGKIILSSCIAIRNGFDGFKYRYTFVGDGALTEIIYEEKDDERE